MIAIPNIDKPKGCGKCEVWSLCHYPKVDKGYDDKVMPDCPLIEIPTPHGRIIDEDEIFKRPHCGECNDATLEAIEYAPTILEAEE